MNEWFWLSSWLLLLLLWVTATHSLSVPSSSSSSSTTTTKNAESSSSNTCGEEMSFLQQRFLEPFGLIIRVFDDDTGRGLMTTKDRTEHEDIIRIPQKDTLTVDTLLQEFAILEKAVVVATSLTDEQVLAMGLLLLLQQEEEEARDDIFSLYVATLPKPVHSVLTMDETTLACLPLAYQKLILAYRQHVDDLYSGLCAAMDKANHPNDDKSSDKESNNKKKNGCVVEKRDFCWAFATVRSRCVGVDGRTDPRVRNGGAPDEQRVLLPAFDLLNHRFGAQTTLTLDEDRQEYVLTSLDPYQSGDQVMISYSDRKDNLQMLMTYGFCPPHNPQAVVFFDLHDMLSACAAARPQYFTPIVQDQIRSLWDKFGKTRDLYRFDANLGRPRACLQQAILLLQELEKQFIQTKQPPDDAFPQHVLNSLLSQRQTQLQQGLHALNSSNDTTPMKQAVQFLLQEEVGWIEKYRTEELKAPE